MNSGFTRNLKFKIGSQLENWEFDISVVNEYIEDDVLYEVYEYIGSDKFFIGIESKSIKLLFNADILEIVEYFFTINMYDEVLAKLKILLGSGIIKSDFSTSWYMHKLAVSVIYSTEHQTVKISYQKLKK